METFEVQMDFNPVVLELKTKKILIHSHYRFGFDPTETIHLESRMRTHLHL